MTTGGKGSRRRHSPGWDENLRRGWERAVGKKPQAVVQGSLVSIEDIFGKLPHNWPGVERIRKQAQEKEQ